jgi:uncharacterized protein (TIGR03086 family)
MIGVVPRCRRDDRGAMAVTEISERYRKVAGQFTERARAVPDGAWDNPAPCDGWVARDVVRHMVEWMPSFFPAGTGVEFPSAPSVDEDPVAAWVGVSDTLQTAVDDPDIAAREFDMRAGRFRVDDAVATFCLGDVLVHTWDLARATGLDETLDRGEVHRLFEGMGPIDDLLRQSGHYGPRVDVPDDADEQTKLIAFTGRDPFRNRGAAR